MTDPTTLGHEPEPTDVAAELDQILWGVMDPLERYNAATAAQVHHNAVVTALGHERGRILAAMNDDGMSYQDIADATMIGTRGRVQQLVEKARKAAHPEGTV